MEGKAMTSPSAFHERLHGLIDAALCGAITAEQAGELDSLLKTDREACEIYSDYASMDAELHLLIRGRSASEEISKQIHDSSDMAHETADDPTATTPPIILPPLHSPLSPLPSPFSTYVSSGWPVAYVVATLIVGMGLVVAALVHVSGPGNTNIVRQSVPSDTPVISRSIAKDECVGRITGMVDCAWEEGWVGGQSSADRQTLVYLGDTFALRSGLLEITYDSGARVILQGPVTYEVESVSGGYLSIGKLTAKLEKKSEGKGQRSVSVNQKSEIGNHEFAVRTPTAIVTDLGTEFGVEVDRQGVTTSYVFRGSVRLQAASRNGTLVGADRVLHQYESARIGADDHRTVTVGPVIKPSAFVREIPKQTVRVLELVDLIAGGDGTSGLRNRAIDPTTGRVTDTPIQAAGDDKDYLRSDGKYHRVGKPSVVDGVFIPDGRFGAFPVDSAGHTFADFSETTGTSPDYVWAGGRNPVDEPGVNPALLAGVNYAAPGHAWLYLHANKGITFDLDAVRRANAGGRLLRFRATAGNTEPASGKGMSVFADLWVIVDGQVRFRRREINGCNGAIPVVIPLRDTDRFLTLAVTDGGNGAGYDWVIFGDPQLDVMQVESP
jgi:hypothetical protein